MPAMSAKPLYPARPQVDIFGKVTILKVWNITDAIRGWNEGTTEFLVGIVGLKEFTKIRVLGFIVNINGQPIKDMRDTGQDALICQGTGNSNQFLVDVVHHFGSLRRKVFMKQGVFWQEISWFPIFKQSSKTSRMNCGIDEVHCALEEGTMTCRLGGSKQFLDQFEALGQGLIEDAPIKHFFLSS